MGYSTPATWENLQVVTPSEMQVVSDDIIDLDRRTTLVSAGVATSQTTTSTSYTDLATAGPSATVTIGTSGLVLVLLTAYMANSTAGNVCLMSVAISGATTSAAGDSAALSFRASANGAFQFFSVAFPFTLNAGTTVFTSKYRVDGGTGTFQGRYISVIPLGA